MELPLVTVICLCFNQARFLQESVKSVLQQTYPNIQLIIVDDASTDNSADLIRTLQSENPAIEVLMLKSNAGNCRAFNSGLEMAKGEYVIDLAADDILLPERVAVGVERLTLLGESYGVHFSDAWYIDEEGKNLRKHSRSIQLAAIPTGDVYADIIEHYFICSPTMMMRKKVLDSLGGYDETLHYEDFDFWIRSARNFLYDYTDEVLVKKRVVSGSLSDKQFRRSSSHWRSTLKVLEKASVLNTSKSENRVLRKRLWYETGYHLKRFSLQPVFSYLRLLMRSV